MPKKSTPPIAISFPTGRYTNRQECVRAARLLEQIVVEFKAENGTRSYDYYGESSALFRYVQRPWKAESPFNGATNWRIIGLWDGDAWGQRFFLECDLSANRLSGWTMERVLETGLTPVRWALARHELKTLLAYVPAITKPSDFAQSSGYNKKDLQASDGAPFLSESFLYPVLGKDDARSVLGRVRYLCWALGFDMNDLESEIAREQAADDDE